MFRLTWRNLLARKVRLVMSALAIVLGIGFLAGVLTFSNGRITLLTKSGEVIYANYSGQAVPTGDGTKVVFSNATFQITGGTGRYHRASGGGDFTGSQELLTGAGTIKLSGKITYRE